MKRQALALGRLVTNPEDMHLFGLRKPDESTRIPATASAGSASPTRLSVTAPVRLPAGTESGVAVRVAVGATFATVSVAAGYVPRYSVAPFT